MIVTVVPPAVGPAVGLTLVTVGAARRRCTCRPAPVALVPPAVVTVTSTVPVAPAGAVAVMLVAVSAVIVADVVPNLTAVALARLVPVIVTVGPASRRSSGRVEARDRSGRGT